MPATHRLGFPFLNSSGFRAAPRKPEKKGGQHRRSKVLEPLHHFLTNNNNASEPPLSISRQQRSKSPNALALSISPKARDEGAGLAPLMRGIGEAVAATTAATEKTLAGGGAGESAPSLVRGLSMNVLSTLLPPSKVKPEEMITLAVKNSTRQSGSVKKMLHAPTLKLYTVNPELKPRR